MVPWLLVVLMYSTAAVASNDASQKTRSSIVSPSPVPPTNLFTPTVPNSYVSSTQTLMAFPLSPLMALSHSRTCFHSSCSRIFARMRNGDMIPNGLWKLDTNTKTCVVSMFSCPSSFYLSL